MRNIFHLMLYCGKQSSESPKSFVFFFLMWFDNDRLGPCSFRQDVPLKHEFDRALRVLIGFSGPDQPDLEPPAPLLPQCSISALVWTSSPGPVSAVDGPVPRHISGSASWMDLGPCYSLVSSAVFVFTLLLVFGWTMDLVHVLTTCGPVLAPC